jgi:DNA-binding response OmpR family regulator
VSSAPAAGTDSTTILVAAEASWVREQVRAAFVRPGQNVIEVARGQDVLPAVAQHHPDLVVLDMQIANMGGVAVAIDLRLEEGEGRLPAVRTMLLLDREADRFLARRADADEELVKPFDAGTLRRAAKRLLATPARRGPGDPEGADAATEADAEAASAVVEPAE